MYTISLFAIILVFLGGLVVGWNVLPQPQWVQNLWNKLTK